MYCFCHHQHIVLNPDVDSTSGKLEDKINDSFIKLQDTKSKSWHGSVHFQNQGQGEQQRKLNMTAGKHNPRTRNKQNKRLLKGTLTRQYDEHLECLGLGTDEGNRLRKGTEQADRGKNEKWHRKTGAIKTQVIETNMRVLLRLLTLQSLVDSLCLILWYFCLLWGPYHSVVTICLWLLEMWKWNGWTHYI